MNFHQHGHAKLRGDGFQCAQGGRIEQGGDEQDGIRAHRAGFKNLPFVQNEILAQDGQRTGSAGGGEVFGRALKEIAVGKHRQTRRAAALIAGSNLRRCEIGANHALAWAGLFDFGNDGGLVLRDARAQRADKIAHRRGCGGGTFQFRQRRLGASGGDFLALARRDGVQNVSHGGAHAARNDCVRRTKSSSRARAAPDAMASRAFCTPSAMDVATLAV